MAVSWIKRSMRGTRCGYIPMMIFFFIIYVTLGELITYLSLRFFKLKTTIIISNIFVSQEFREVTNSKGDLSLLYDV